MAWVQKLEELADQKGEVEGEFSINAKVYVWRADAKVEMESPVKLLKLKDGEEDENGKPMAGAVVSKSEFALVIATWDSALRDSNEKPQNERDCQK